MEPSHARNLNRNPQPRQRVWQVCGGQQCQLRGAGGGGVRLPGAEWRGQNHDDQDDCRVAQTHIGHGESGRVRHPHAAAACQGLQRLRSRYAQSVRQADGARAAALCRRPV